ncbi:MAG: RNA 2',3'-cyclic phosphodiesterase [Thermoplasmata archaeon]
MVLFAIKNGVIRAFIAIEVPVFETVVKFQEELAHAGRMKLVEPENLHFTLKFLGDIEENITSDIIKILEAFKFPAFKVTLRGCGAFPSLEYVKIVWIGTDENPLEQMSVQIDKKLMMLGFKMEKEHLPHLTVARVKSRIDKSILEKYRDTEFGSFNAEYIKLKKSILTEEGPIYKDIDTIKLYIP